MMMRGFLGGLLALVLVAACDSPVTPTPPPPVTTPATPAPPPDPAPTPAPGPPPAPAPPAPAPPAPAPPPPAPPRTEVWRLAVDRASPEFPLSGEVPLQVTGENATWGTWQGRVMQRSATTLLVLFYDGGPPHTGSLNLFKSGDGWQFSFNGVAGQASGRVVQLPEGTIGGE